jgi:hypothetical protein
MFERTCSNTDLVFIYNNCLNAEVKTTLLLATYQRPSMPKVEIVLERAPTFEKEFDNKQRRDQEREEVRKNLEEGRKRIQDSLKTLSSQTPQ